MLRTASPLAFVAGLTRERARALDPELRVMRVASFAEMRELPLARPRWNALLIGLFGVTALLLTAIGLYAVVGASVRQRSCEIGVRMALGATAADVRRLVLAEALRLSLPGFPRAGLRVSTPRRSCALSEPAQPGCPFASGCGYGGDR